MVGDVNAAELALERLGPDADGRAWTLMVHAYKVGVWGGGEGEEGVLGGECAGLPRVARRPPPLSVPNCRLDAFDRPCFVTTCQLGAASSLSEWFVSDG